LLWTYDHLYPIVGDPHGPIFEGWLTIAAWAATTERVRIAKLESLAEGFNNPTHAAQRYSWIRPPSTSLRSTGVRGVHWTCGVRLPAGTAKLSPRCGLSAT
jgi:hypothetical protein